MTRWNFSTRSQLIIAVASLVTLTSCIAESVPAPSAPPQSETEASCAAQLRICLLMDKSLSTRISFLAVLARIG